MDETAPTDPREQRAQRIQRRFEWPVVVTALLTIPILIIQESDFSEPWGTISTVLNWGTWLVFFAEAAVVPDCCASSVCSPCDDCSRWRG